jgi:predicted RNA-binding Zn-ribbon protein involved in translation (DUF1610 family)
MSKKMLSQQTIQTFPNDLMFIQSRAEINLSIVDEYSQMMKDGIVFDPVEGVQNESGAIFVYDGFHRGEAAKMVGMLLLVNLRPGNRTEAEWLALTANQKHGLHRTNQDKQRVVRQALLHPYGVQLSNREIARHCGVDDKTVGRIRRAMEVTAELPQLNKRVVKKANRETYEIDTTHIGARPVQPAVETSHRLAQATGQSPKVNVNGYQARETLASPLSEQLPDHVNLATRLSSAEPLKYQPTTQEFKCPRCGEEKIVGVNGSRRWCLNCLAEWPTAVLFLAEVNATQQVLELPTRQQLQSRFLTMLAQLDEQDGRLSRINAWLDTLETQLDLTDNVDDPDETVLPIASIPVLEYA